MRYKKFLLLLVLFVGIDIVLYWNLWNTFFQQDEWGLFGRSIYQLDGFPLSLFTFSGAHFHPMGNLIWMILYKTLGTNATGYGFLSILIHSVTAVIAYYFFGLFTKSRRAQFILSFLFLVSYPTKQVVVWYAASPYIIPCIAGIMLFFLYLNKCKAKKEISIKAACSLFSIWVVSMLFREEAVIIIPLLPISILLFWNKDYIPKLRKKVIELLVLMFAIVLIRYFFESFFGDNVVYEQGNIHVMRLYNSLTVPLKMIIQNLIELEQLWDISRMYNRFAFPERIIDGVIIETAIFEHMVLYLSIPLLFVSGFIFSRMNTRERKILIFSLAWIFFASVIVGLQSRRLYFLESRYLYLGSIGVLLLLYSMFSALSRTKFISETKLFLVVVGLSTVFFFYSWFNIQRVMNDTYLAYSIERKEILKQITTLHPTIPKTVIFYVECRDKDDCISNNLVLPFQSGVGQMLLVIYGSAHPKEYGPYFKGFYLWDWEAEGYREIDGYGFGYYRQEETILKDLKRGRFLPQEIIALQYDKSENKIKEISKEFRKRVIKKLSASR